MATAGYSGTPLARKLGLKDGMAVLALGAPEALLDWLQPLPPGVHVVQRVGADTAVVLLFTASAAELARQLAAFRQRLKGDTALWVCWPKKAPKVPTDITEDTIRHHALPLGWVDVKVCAVSEVWSGLRLVVRKELRKEQR